VRYGKRRKRTFGTIANGLREAGNTACSLVGLPFDGGEVITSRTAIHAGQNRRTDMAGFAHYLGLNYGMHRAKQAQQANAHEQAFNGGLEESLIASEKVANNQQAAQAAGIEESLAASGDTAVGQPSRPKYRLPTEEEAKQKVADIKAFGGLGAGAVGLSLGPIGSALTTGAAEFALTKFEPSLEKYVRESPTIPVYENWEESDYWQAYQGS